MAKSPELLYMEHETELEKQGKLSESGHAWSEDKPKKSKSSKKTAAEQKKQNQHNLNLITNLKYKKAFGKKPSQKTLDRLMASGDPLGNIKTMEAQKGQGWSLKDGYMVPPGQSSKGFNTPEELKKLGDLTEELNKVKKGPKNTLGQILKGTKAGNIASLMSNIGNKLKEASIKQKMKDITSPGVKSNEPENWSEDANIMNTSKPKSDPLYTPMQKTTQPNSVGGGVSSNSGVSSNKSGDKYDLNLSPSDDPIVKMQQDLMKYSSELKKPYMQWGDEAMQELKTKVSEGAFTPDGTAVKDFKFKELVDDFNLQEYGKERPGITKFESGEAPDMYSTGKAYTPHPYGPSLRPDSAYKTQGRSPRMRPDSAYETRGRVQQLDTGKPYETEGQAPEFQREDQYTPEQSKEFKYRDPYQREGQAPEFSPEDVYKREDYQETARRPEDLRDSSFEGRDIVTDYDRYQGKISPEMRKISAESEVDQYTPEGTRPDIYRAGDAPKSEYYDPSGQEVSPAYQAKEFRVEDDPGYQRRYDKAMDAISASAAARGMQLSGATLKALQEEAANIASEETQAAYGRYADQRGFEAAQEREDYARQQAQEDRVSAAMQFKNADQYQKYLDNVGIRRDEQQQLIQQFESDRAFGANQNKENWLREQATKQMGRELNQDEFSRWMQTEGKDFAQYANERDWTTAQSNLAADKDFQKYAYEKEYLTDRYDTAMRDYRADQAEDWKKHVYGTEFEAAQADKQYGRDLAKHQMDREDYYRQQEAQKAAEQEQYERGLTKHQLDTDSHRWMEDKREAADIRGYGRDLTKHQMDREDYYRQQEAQKAAEQEQYERGLTKHQLGREDFYKTEDMRRATEQEDYERNLMRHQMDRDDWYKGEEMRKAAEQEDYERNLTKYQHDTDKFRWQESMKKAAEQEQYERDKALYGDKADMYKYQTGMDFQADQAYQQAQQQAYGQDKADFYNLQNQKWQQNLGNLAAQQQHQTQQYGQLKDVYGMDAAAKAQQYGTLQDIVGKGLQAQDVTTGMGQGYTGFMTDWDVNKANLQMAKQKQKSDKAWNVANFFGNMLS